MKNRTFFWQGLSIGFLTLAPSAFAIKGTYLPESELLGSVCKIQVGKLTTTYTPSLPNGRPTGQRPFTDVMTDLSMCTSTLVAPDTILTAAHCFVGNQEQLYRKGKFPYPVMDEKGEQPADCQREDWPKVPKCVEGIVFGFVTSKWEKTELVCPTKDGKTETRPLEEARGYPNPLFRSDNGSMDATRKNFDFAIWKVAQPFTNTEITPVETNWDRVLESVRKNPRSCRSFGYGLDNDDKSGTLRGAYTPVTAMSKKHIVSDLVPTDEGPMMGGGRTDHGDSGGPIVCTGTDGVDRVYGVTSRGGEDFVPRSPQVAEYGIYSLLSFNRGWIEYAAKNGPALRDLNKKTWHDFVLPYERAVLETAIADAKACVQKHRREMGSYSYKQVFWKACQAVEKQYEDAVKEYRKYGDDSGLLRARMIAILPNAYGIEHDCGLKKFMQ